MHIPHLQHLRAACLRGDAAAAQRLLAGRAAFGCLGDCTAEREQALAGALLAPLPGDAGNTLLHHLASGEALGVGGCLLLSLAGGSPRTGSGSSSSVWPSRHQRGRAQVLALLLARQPRLALLAGTRNAAGHTPLHCCVTSRSWQVLALLLAALQQLLGPAGMADSQQAQQQQQQQQQGTLHLLLSVPDAGGLSALELAIKLRQWPAVRLLAAAAGGGLPLSRDQIAACSLVQQYLGLSRSSSGNRLAGGSEAAAAGEQQGIRVSASGATVTEALGGLLSKLWDAFSATPAGEAAVDELAAAARLEGPQTGSGSGEDEGSSSAVAGEASGSRQGHQPLGREQQRRQTVSLRLQPKAASKADVMVLVQKEEQQAAAGSAPQPVAATAAVAAGTAAAAEGDAAAPCHAAASSSGEQGHCMVCYEEVPQGEQSGQLPCGHCTCDACWRGILQASIDEGDPRRAMCPEPGCGTALPSAAAARLLPPAALDRYQLLVVQRYMTAHPQVLRCCPQAACGAMLHLPGVVAPGRQMHAASPDTAGGEGTAEQQQAAAAGGSTGVARAEAAGPAAEAAAGLIVAAPGAGLDAECADCGHLLCWRCGEEAHEPASCAQMRRWGEELAELRAAAPSADVQWLTSNTKRCPQCMARIQAGRGSLRALIGCLRQALRVVLVCKAWLRRLPCLHSHLLRISSAWRTNCSFSPLQKHGGCNHMACKGCGHHFCWVCGRAWRQHSETTGGFFYCNLEQHHELPEYSMASSGASEAGSGGGPLAWLAGVWGSIKAAAQQQQLQRHLRQYLRLSGSRGALFAAAAQMQRLLAAAGVARCGDGSSSGGGSCSGGSVGPEVLGVSSSEAAHMSDLEWAQLVAAAAASAADAAALQLPALAVGASKSAAEDALACASHSSSPARATAYLSQLAEGVAAARGLLQHSAVALYQLPSGNHRRQLQQLSAGMQAKLDQLEPLLLALPERESLPPEPSGRQPIADPAAQASSGGGSCDSWGNTSRQGSGSGGGSNGGGGGGFAGWLLHKWYGVEAGTACASKPDPAAPECHPALASLSPEVLLQQAQFAAAVHQQRRAVEAVLRALWSDMRQMHAAARAGLYAS